MQARFQNMSTCNAVVTRQTLNSQVHSARRHQHAGYSGVQCSTEHLVDFICQCLLLALAVDCSSDWKRYAYGHKTS